MGNSMCRIEGCEKKAFRRNLCAKHYRLQNLEQYRKYNQRCEVEKKKFLDWYYSSKPKQTRYELAQKGDLRISK
jgi:hypothetical protein